MLDTVLSYEDWRDFFTKNLLETGRFSYRFEMAKTTDKKEVASTHDPLNWQRSFSDALTTLLNS